MQLAKRFQKREKAESDLKEATENGTWSPVS